jgi:predicted nuclease with RNAse H fold
MNVSEMFSRMKEGMWRRREERLRQTPIEILPPAASAGQGP